MAAKEVLNEKKLMFFQDFTDNVRKIFNDDIVKYNVLSWIIFNTNYSQEYQGLKVRECYFSYSILEEKLNVTRYKLQKIMKELINEGFIEWVSKSKSKGESSVLKLNFQYGLEYGYQYSSQYGLCTENTIRLIIWLTIRIIIHYLKNIYLKNNLIIYIVQMI